MYIVVVVLCCGHRKSQSSSRHFPIMSLVCKCNLLKEEEVSAAIINDFTMANLCVHPFIPVPQILAYVRFLYNHFHSLYM